MSGKSTTTSKARTRRTPQAEVPAVKATVSRASRRGKYVFVFEGEASALAAQLGELPAVAPVRTREKDGVTRISVRVGANPAARILGTVGVENKASASVAAGEDTGGRPYSFTEDEVATVATWIGQATRVWAERRATGHTGVAGTDAVDSVAVGIAAGDASVEDAMRVRATIARRPTIQRAAVIKAIREAAAATTEEATK